MKDDNPYIFLRMTFIKKKLGMPCNYLLLKRIKSYDSLLFMVIHSIKFMNEKCEVLVGTVFF